MVWNDVRAPHSVRPVPKVRDEDREFALRLGNVLRELRMVSGWSQEKAAEKVGVPVGTLGRWERGDHAPKGYDLGRLYRMYEPHGARWEWFLDPPEVVIQNPVRDRLAELARGATALALEDLEAEGAKRRAASAQRAERRRRRPA